MEKPKMHGLLNRVALYFFVQLVFIIAQQYFVSVELNTKTSLKNTYNACQFFTYPIFLLLCISKDCDIFGVGLQRSL